MRTLIVNFKNYPEVLGPGALKLAKAVEKASAGSKARVILSPPSPFIGVLSGQVDLKVYAQDVDPDSGDRTTGAVLLEAIKGAGAAGTILNHSESRKPTAVLRSLVPRARSLGLEVCLCAKDPNEAVGLAGLDPQYVAVEPPELIGSGVAVSRAKPELVTRTVGSLRSAGYRGGVLCGAGIVSGQDVEKAIDLGADGVLVSSAVVRARDWEVKLEELVRSLK